MGQILCPRCEVNYYTPYGSGPNDGVPYPALSRVVDTYICNDCGVHEAFIDLAQLPPIPPDEWPIELPEMKEVPLT